MSLDITMTIAFQFSNISKYFPNISVLINVNVKCLLLFKCIEKHIIDIKI